MEVEEGEGTEGEAEGKLRYAQRGSPQENMENSHKRERLSLRETKIYSHT